MFVDLLQSVTDQYAKNLPFVIYRKPKEQKVCAVFQQDAQVHYVNNFKESGFVFAPFDKTNKSVLIPLHNKLEAIYVPKITLEKGKENIIVTTAKQQKFHLDLVQKGITTIKTGSLEKVVLSRVLEAKFKSPTLLLFQNLLDQYSNAFCYLWHHPKVGTWIGATPEILLKAENQQLTTMSLAGTQKYVAGHLPEWGKKEIDEQQLVTNYISDALKTAVSNLNISTRESVRAGNLWHLRTKLTGTFEKGNLAAIIQALHPTPAVCGLPLVAAKNFILENEGYPREFYTGYLGELNFKEVKERSSNRRNQENKAYTVIKKTTTLFVNLRCMQLKQHQANIYIGGGITEGSDPDKEWQETIAKSTTMLHILKPN